MPGDGFVGLSWREWPGSMSSRHRGSLKVRKVRLLTVLAILLTLPGYGLAGLAQRSCQEEMRASNAITLVGDCCPGKSDQGTACKQHGDSPLGKKAPCSACKAGYNGKSPQSFEPATETVLRVVPTAFLMSSDPPPLLLPHRPEGLWRPPRSI